MASPDAELIASPRLLWYNPMLDPRLIAEKMTPAMAVAAESGYYDDGTAKQGGPLNRPGPDYPFNLISSLCEDGRHRPALDVDMLWPPLDATTEITALLGAVFDDPGRVVVVRSTRYWHAYLPDVVLSWPDYQRLLDDLVDVCIVERGYVAASKNRGQTLLRPPHIRKITRSAVRS